MIVKIAYGMLTITDIKSERAACFPASAPQAFRSAYSRLQDDLQRGMGRGISYFVAGRWVSVTL